MSIAIAVRNLGKRYSRYDANRPWTIQEALLGGFRRLRPKEFWAVRDVSFTLPRGHALGIVGRNGAGKSTMLRLLGGLGQPDEGQIEIHGRLSGLLDLGAGFHGDLTGRENVFINGVVSGLTRSEVADQFDSIIDFAELGDVVDSPLRTYSSGMQLRLAFAVAAHIMPEVLLIDEILAVGDAAFQQKCLNRIRQFKRAMCSIVVVSHDVGVIREICDSALLLSGGRVAAYGDPAEVAEKYLSGEGGGCELCGVGGSARLHSEL